MRTYYIYHIIGVKIGCSYQPKYRVNRQGYSEYEILEEHTDIYEASRREKILQAEYGYEVDQNEYWIAVENGAKSNALTKEAMAKGGRNSVQNMRSHLTKEILASGGKAGKGVPKVKSECPHCKRMIAHNLIDRWHNDNCALKE
tara:strand:+ start:58 stop:489 length:432 start_codon:yes stop_codon:yes gene_type:complete